MARIVLVLAIVTLLFFIVLTARLFQYSLGARSAGNGQHRKSRYQRLISKARQLYMYSWLLAAGGIGAGVALIVFAESPAPTSVQKLVLALASASLVVTVTGVVWGELLLARARLVRGGQVHDSLSEDSTPAFR